MVTAPQTFWLATHLLPDRLVLLLPTSQVIGLGTLSTRLFFLERDVFLLGLGVPP